jgi:hypothetical protein
LYLFAEEIMPTFSADSLTSFVDALFRAKARIPLDDGTWGQLVKKAEGLQVTLPETSDTSPHR